MNLKQCLSEHQLTISGLAKHLHLSIASASLIVNKQQFPKSGNTAAIKNEIQNYLNLMGIKHQLSWESGATDDQQELSKDKEMLSQDARKCFGIFRNPFDGDVEKAADVFQNGETRFIREAMFQTAKNGGLLAVIGESGAGKSTLRRDLIDRCAQEMPNLIFVQPRTVDKTKLSAGGICDAIILDISQEKPVSKHEHKARQVERVLVNSHKSGNSHCLIIEEAHDLNLWTLKYLKRIYEIELGFKKLIPIILIGQPELTVKLDERTNYEAREFIRRCEVLQIQAMVSPKEIESYLGLKLKNVGVDIKKIFAESAFSAIVEKMQTRVRGGKGTTSTAYPLNINNYCVRLMNRCAELGLPQITSDLVKEV